MFFFSLAKRAAATALIVFVAAPAFAQSPTRTRLVTQSPSPVSRPVTMTAEVDSLGGGAPRGSVSFADGATNLGSVPLTVPGAGQATLAAGGSHTCALTSSGGVKCWGRNEFGALGDGTTIRRTTPVDVVGLTSGVVAVAAGGGHTCALTSIGAVKCWGYNAHGQVGDATRQHRSTPVAVPGLSSGVSAIAAGSAHTCALTATGRVMCWGDNALGQLGNGATSDRYWPWDVDDPGTVYTALATGGASTCGVTSAGALKCWGSNPGNRTTDHQLRPVQVFGLSHGVAAVNAGGSITCATTTAGALKCWGYNAYGAVGDGNAYNRWAPAQVVGLESGVVAASAGGYHTCALLSTGAVRCWGLNQNGQLGDGTVTKRYTSVAVSNLGGFAVSLASGGGHTCALLSPSRILRCWGDNESGQIGDGTTTNRLLPVTTTGFSGLLRGRARLARTLAAGVHPLQARYLSDAAHAASSSAIVQHKVQ